MPNSSKTYRWVLPLILAATFFINNEVIVPDIMESRNIVTAREMVYDGHWMISTMNGDLRLEKPPLPTWLTAVAEIIAPDNLGLQRGMAGLAAVMLVFFFCRFASRILHIRPLIPALFFCTCYNLILMGRTASWDIYCHAFMMGGIYYLARAFQADDCRWKDFIAAGVFTGLSIMSKGPVSLYGLFLSFLVAYAWYYRPHMKGKWGALSVMVVIALAVGSWWYLYVHLFHPEALAAVIDKESGSWINHNVRPWYYYWKFFLETGVWSLLLLTAIILPLFQRSEGRSREYLFSLTWMLTSLVLLSLLPEKKSRYLLPLLIPACYTMGTYLMRWIKVFHRRCISPLDKWGYAVNAWLITAVVVALPVAAWFFVYRPEYVSLLFWLLFTVFCLFVAACLALSAWKRLPMGMLWGVTLFFVAAECFVLPALKNVINNPEMKSIAQTREMEELNDIPFYYNAKDPLRIELVYAAHRNIRPLEVTTAADLADKLPCVLLTHQRVGDELPAALWKKVDTVYVDRFDDNSRPKAQRTDFIYHVTLLKAKHHSSQKHR